MDIYTIGHSNVSSTDIIALLQAHRVETLVDVRSTPYSRYNSQFNRESFQVTLEEAGIEYVYAGQYLGGRPQDPTCYADGQVDYKAIATKLWYQRGIQRLIEIAEEHRTAIMCGEEDPFGCHRHNLVTQTLLEQGVLVWHIRRDGRVEQACALAPEVVQLSFGGRCFADLGMGDGRP